MPAALIAIVLALAAYGGFLFTFTQHLQGGLRDTALQAGLTFVPLAAGFALSSLNWRRLPARWHQLVIPAGCVIAAIGYLLIGITVANGGTGGLVLPLALFTGGFGQGMAASPILTVALSKVAPQDAPEASGVLTTIIQLGLVIGVATFGSVFLTEAVLPGGRHQRGAPKGPGQWYESITQPIPTPTATNPPANSAADNGTDCRDLCHATCPSTYRDS